jgi:hypothetical protein
MGEGSELLKREAFSKLARNLTRRAQPAIHEKVPAAEKSLKKSKTRAT